jgi:hypothetical protein
MSMQGLALESVVDASVERIAKQGVIDGSEVCADLVAGGFGRFGFNQSE